MLPIVGEAHVLNAERLHCYDTTVPVLAKGKTDTGRIWVYVRDDKPFGGPAPPAAVFHYSRDRVGAHPQTHLADYNFRPTPTAAMASFTNSAAGQALLEAACWVRARQPFFVMADLAENARRKAQGKKPAVISPLALEAARLAQTRIFLTPNPTLTAIAGCNTGSQPDNPLF